MPLRAAPMSVPTDLAVDVLELRGRAEIATGQHVAGIRTFEARAALLPDDVHAARTIVDSSTSSCRIRRTRACCGRHVAARARLARVAGHRRKRGHPRVAGGVACATGSCSTLNTPARRSYACRQRGADRADGCRCIDRAAAAARGQAGVRSLGGARRLRGGLVRLGVRHAHAGRRLRHVHGAAAATSSAIADGASVVVGPLLKEDVLAVVNAQPSGLPVPTLALNSALPEGALPPSFLFQFALDPEQEARAVARRIAEDGLVRGIALFPEGAWASESTRRSSTSCSASAPSR